MLEKLLIIFFGPDNDMVREPIKGYDGDKSEVHKAIEKHVGHEFSIDEYKAGMIRGPSGKSVSSHRYRVS